MRLKKSQKEAVIQWIAEGVQSDEINERASRFDPPFEVFRQQVDYYRKTRDAAIKAIVAAGEQEALTEGLALKGERVKKLKQLAALMENDLFGGFLWLDQVKGVGSGDIAQIVDYEEFNAGEVVQYRGVLDDIAKEVGYVLNPKSTKQLREYFFDKKGHTPIKMSKGGSTGVRNPSCDSTFLEHIAPEDAVAKLVLEHRDYSKLHGTYIKGLHALFDPNDRIHTRFNQDVARTGRLSSATPNLQNVPRPENDKWNLRSAVHRTMAGQIRGRRQEQRNHALHRLVYDTGDRRRHTRAGRS